MIATIIVCAWTFLFACAAAGMCIRGERRADRQSWLLATHQQRIYRLEDHHEGMLPGLPAGDPIEAMQEAEVRRRRLR